DRVAALGLVAVPSGQPDVDVLAGEVTRPIRDVEQKARHARRLMDELDELGLSPQEGPPRSHAVGSDFVGMKANLPSTAARAKGRRNCCSRSSPRSQAAAPCRDERLESTWRSSRNRG